MTALYAQPPNMANITLPPCFIGVISFVQVRFGILRPRTRPNTAARSVYIAMIAIVMSDSARVIFSVKTPQSVQKRAGTPERSICTLSFALSTCQALTGRDCASHIDLPSSDIEGAVMSIAEIMAHIAAHRSTGTVSGCSTNAALSTSPR